MAESRSPQAQFLVEGQADGSVEFRINDARGRPVVQAHLTAKEVSGFITELLNAAHWALVRSGENLPPPATEEAIKPCPANALSVGHTQNPNELVLVTRVGKSQVAYRVPGKELLNLGRSFIKATTAAHSPLSTWALLRRILGDFFSDLRGWGAVFRARFSAASRRTATLFWSFVSGRSFSRLRRITLSPGSPVPSYEAVGECIYCGSKVYSPPPGRQYPLGAEHIIAQGLGGTLELPLASCQKHEVATGALVEGDVLGRTLKALRIHLNLKKKKGPPPRSLPLDADVKGVGETRINVAVDDFPIVFNMPIHPEPLATPNATGGGKPVRGFVVATLRYDPGLLFRKYKINSCATASWDNLMLSRMLAKIAHAFAVAELGLRSFKPAHLDLINEGKVTSASMIGGDSDQLARASKTSPLHVLEIGYQRVAKQIFVVAKITLFARHGGPTYAVFVGQSLESSMARFKRVLSRRISSILAR